MRGIRGKVAVLWSCLTRTQAVGVLPVAGVLSKQVPAVPAAGSGGEVKLMTYVVLRDNESSESLIKRFRKKVSNDRILSELRKRRYYITKGEQDRIAKRKGIARARRRERKMRNRRNRW